MGMLEFVPVKGKLVGKKLKEVHYYCPSCRRQIMRLVTRAEATRLSWCGKAGRRVRMRKVKAPRKSAPRATVRQSYTTGKRK